MIGNSSASILAAREVAVAIARLRPELNLMALSTWLCGGMLYIWMMSLIFYRYAFFRFSPGDLAPPDWINMGATAISTLAGSLLILNAPHAPYLASLLPFLPDCRAYSSMWRWVRGRSRSSACCARRPAG